MKKTYRLVKIEDPRGVTLWRIDRKTWFGWWEVNTNDWSCGTFFSESEALAQYNLLVGNSEIKTTVLMSNSVQQRTEP